MGFDKAWFSWGSEPRRHVQCTSSWTDENIRNKTGKVSKLVATKTMRWLSYWILDITLVDKYYFWAFTLIGHVWILIILIILKTLTFFFTLIMFYQGMEERIGEEETWWNPQLQNGHGESLWFILCIGGFPCDCWGEPTDTSFTFKWSWKPSTQIIMYEQKLYLWFVLYYLLYYLWYFYSTAFLYLYLVFSNKICIFFLMQDAMRLLTPILLNYLIGYFEEDSTVPQLNAYLYAGGIALACIVQVIQYSQNFIQEIQHLQILLPVI